MKSSLGTQLNLFAGAVLAPALSADNRMKAVALLQSLLVEAVSVKAAEPMTPSAKEAGNDQDLA